MERLCLCVALLSPLLCTAHIHVQMSYDDGEWRLFLYDFFSGEFDPADVPIVAGHEAFNFVSANAFTNLLGRAGSEVWVLPETGDPRLPFLGIGTSRIPSGTFVNNQIRLHLNRVTGPGHFALFNIDPFGQPIPRMNSRDGIDLDADAIALAAVGGHVHINWAFSAPGTYRVGFSASGRRASTGQIHTSPIVEYTFIVRDLPWRPHLTAVRDASPGTLLMTLQSGPDRLCRVESSTNFLHWNLVTNVLADTAPIELRLPTSTNHATYYRALIAP